MFTRNKVVLLLAVASVGINVAKGQNLVTNGSFENPTAPLEPGWIEISSGSSFLGWTVSGSNAVDVHAGEHGVPWTNISDGIQAIDLNGTNAAGIYQDLTTVSGSNYNLQFYMSANPACSPSTVQIQVSFSGNVVDTPIFNTTGSTLANMRWDVHNYVVSATSSLSRLAFTSQTFGTSCGPVIDAVEVTPVLINVGGSVTGTRLKNVVCKNVTTGQRLRIKGLKGSASWDCTTAGLQTKTGDIIQEIIIGIIK